ncbi:hypothetical protein [Euzebya sp.]|uniref:hypothetical protein n=1 Tax=Euzebya sp. TaxID=1971409 RepID=UPI003513797D
MDLFEGVITGLGFASGDAVVVGTWARSPFGRVVDVMWRRADGRRVLLAPDDAVASYVADLYDFDEVAVVAISGGLCGAQLSVRAEPLAIRAEVAPADWRSWVFALRPRALRRSPAWIRIEDVLARPVVGRLLGGGEGVRAAGVAPGGQAEVYGADDWRRIRRASLRVDGRDAGPLSDLPADFGVGLSAFPTVPASVWVGTQIDQRRR